jgi:glyoxylase-like metal-dependent hydrolase (beta-lactamase superfamily II)
MAGSTSVPLGRFGALDCSLVSDGTLRPMRLAEILPTATAPELERAGRSSSESVASPTNCLLVRSDSVVLVDAGLGRELSDETASAAGRLLNSLSTESLAATDVDCVVVTHCHPDHIGGLTSGGSPVFPRARHLLSRREWEFWTTEEANAAPAFMRELVRERMSTLLRAGLLELTDDQVEIAAGLRAFAAPGHTPGHLAVEAESGGGFLLYVGDAVLDELQLDHPSWTGFSDWDAEAAATT